jgi:hypothetical protein
MSTLPPPPTTYPDAPSIRQSVVITDVDMTIGAMCRFMVKWVIASIPAVIILWLMMFVALLIISVVFGGLLHGLMGSFPHRY